MKCQRKYTGDGEMREKIREKKTHALLKAKVSLGNPDFGIFWRVIFEVL